MAGFSVISGSVTTSGAGNEVAIAAAAIPAQRTCKNIIFSTDDATIVTFDVSFDGGTTWLLMALGTAGQVFAHFDGVNLQVDDQIIIKRRGGTDITVNVSVW